MTEILPDLPGMQHFRQLRHRLTLLATGVTAALLYFLTGLSLHLAKISLLENEYALFLREANAMILTLQETDVISLRQIRTLSEKSHLKIILYDNGAPLFSVPDQTADEALLKTLQNVSAETYDTALFPAPPGKLTVHTEFRYPVSRRKQYAVSAGYIPKAGGTLSFLMLTNESGLLLRLRRLTWLLLFLDALGTAALFLFFRRFTGLLIRPVFLAREKQARFTAAASHELRAPLAVLRTGLSSLEAAEDPAEKARLFAVFGDELTRLSHLSDELLLLFSADAGRLSLQKTDCFPEELLLSVYELYEPVCRRNTLSLSVSLPPEDAEMLPPCRLDRERLMQVFGILLNNAISYTPAGGEIFLTAACKNGQLFFTVEDNGPGIPDEKKDAVFDRFYRVEESHGSQHLGLGLSIAKEIIAAHRGTIEIKDRPGGGTVFCIRFPYS